MARVVNMIVEFDRIDVINIISLNRLILGGAAMLIARKINHHSDRVGEIMRIPFVIKVLRVWVIIYVRFVRMNRAEEHSP